MTDLKFNGHAPPPEFWLATPMLRLARNKAKSSVTIQQLWVEQNVGREDWRELPMIDVEDEKPAVRA